MDNSTKSKHNNLFNIIRYAGTYIGAVIGAGFASGQELLQFFVSYGYLGIIGALLVTILFAWYGSLFMELGHKLKTSTHKPVFDYLCGEKLGKIFDWILSFFLFGVLAVMISGGGATLNQHFGINIFVGKIIITVATVGTVLLGFDSALTALGFLAPLIIIMTLAISIGTIFTNFEGLLVAGQAVRNIEIIRATPFWWSSTLIYVSYCVLPSVPALASIGNEESDVSVIRKAGIVGGIALGAGVLCMVLALLSKIQDVASFEVPFLEVARQMHPIIGLILLFVLLAAIYTTAVPILYGFSIRFAQDGTPKFKVLSIIAGVIAFIAGMFPFSALVSTIYPLLGYIGLIVMASGFYKAIIKNTILPVDSSFKEVKVPKPQ